MGSIKPQAFCWGGERKQSCRTMLSKRPELATIADPITQYNKRSHSLLGTPQPTKYYTCSVRKTYLKTPGEKCMILFTKMIYIQQMNMMGMGEKTPKKKTRKNSPLVTISLSMIWRPIVFRYLRAPKTS